MTLNSGNAPVNSSATPSVFRSEYGGLCNRSACRRPGATWFNHSTRAYYCTACAASINRFDQDGAKQLYGHSLCTYGQSDEDLNRTTLDAVSQ